jgi:hypothetical protein
MTTLNTECHYAECHYAQCRYTRCHYAECRGTRKYYCEYRPCLSIVLENWRNIFGAKIFLSSSKKPLNAVGHGNGFVFDVCRTIICKIMEANLVEENKIISIVVWFH